MFWVDLLIGNVVYIQLPPVFLTFSEVVPLRVLILQLSHPDPGGVVTENKQTKKNGRVGATLYIVSIKM